MTILTEIFWFAVEVFGPFLLLWLVGNFVVSCRKEPLP